MRAGFCACAFLFLWITSAQAAYIGSSRDPCTTSCTTVVSRTCDASSYEQARDCLACAQQGSTASTAAASWLTSCTLSERDTNEVTRPGPPPIVGVASDPLSRAFFDMFLIVSGFIGMPLIIATVSLSKTVHRDAVFINFCATWIVLSISFVLLGLSGQQDQLFPDKTLCAIQATLTYASLAMTQISTLSLVAQFALRVREITTASSDRVRAFLTGFLLGSPWLTFVIYATGAIVDIKSLDSDIPGEIPAGLVLNDAFWCRTTDMGAFLPIVGIVLAANAVTLILEAGIAYWLFSRWRLLRGQKQTGVVSVSTLVRLVLFTLYAIAVVAIAATILTDPSMQSVGDFLQSTLPFAVFIIFGTSSDILSVWASVFRFKREPAAQKLVSVPRLMGSHFSTATQLDSEAAVVAAVSSAQLTRQHSWISEGNVSVAQSAVAY